MAEVTWVEGDTSQRVFVLTQNGAVVDLTGATIEAMVRPAGGSGLPARFYAAVIVSAVEGKVGWSPPSETTLVLTESPYKGRFRVTLGGAKSYFPYPGADTWTVVE